MSKTLIPKMKKRCKDCPPMVVPPRSYTPSRPSCIQCVEKHLGAAYVLLTELNDLPDPPSPVGSGVAGDEATRRQDFSRRLRAIAARPTRLTVRCRILSISRPLRTAFAPQYSQSQN